MDRIQFSPTGQEVAALSCHIIVCVVPFVHLSPPFGESTVIEGAMFFAKAAVTTFDEFMNTTQVIPLEVLQPDQPVKAESVAASAYSVTVGWVVKVSLQSLPQSMPGVGELITRPLPVPCFWTVRVCVDSVGPATVINDDSS